MIVQDACRRRNPIARKKARRRLERDDADDAPHRVSLGTWLDTDPERPHSGSRESVARHQPMDRTAPRNQICG